MAALTARLPRVAFAFSVTIALMGCRTERDRASTSETAAPAPAAASPVAVQPAIRSEVHAQVRPVNERASAEGAVGLANMVEVPAGSVEIDGESHTVAAFAIDHTEVTTAAYARCVDERKCTPPASGDADCNWPKRKARGDHPMNCVTFGQATAYCKANGRRLPTAAEWQLAAGGPEHRTYPWGSAPPSNINAEEPAAGPLKPGPARHNLCWVGDGTDGEKYPRGTCPVGSHPAGNTPSGIADMAGNVAEWTSTTETAPHGLVLHVLKGGGHRFDRMDRPEVAVTDSETQSDKHQDADTGFRCAVTLGVR